MKTRVMSVNSESNIYSRVVTDLQDKINAACAAIEEKPNEEITEIRYVSDATGTRFMMAAFIHVGITKPERVVPGTNV
jgi:hypothetical protein